MSKMRINRQGERWCHHRKWKRVYESIDDAWMAAFGTFLACGAILVPYRCARMKLSIAVVRVRVSKNPYATNPFQSVLGARRWRVRGCGFWHLTSSSQHVLTAELDR